MIMKNSVAVSRSSRHLVAGLLASLVLTLSVPSVASAQLSAFGASKLAASGAARGTDSAYDPINHVWLVVTAYGAVSGVFVTDDGVSLGGAFTLNGATDVFAHYPRATYSRDLNSGAGGFLVTWHENISGTFENVVHMRNVCTPPAESLAPRESSTPAMAVRGGKRALLPPTRRSVVSSSSPGRAAAAAAPS